MKIIGFAGKFYTLWDYQKEVHYSTTAYYEYIATGVTHKYFYIKNISTDIEKVKSLFPYTPIDDSLRGKVRSWEITEKIDYPSEYFPFGKLKGSLIAESDDVWQLNRLYEGFDIRRKALARRRLIELGEIVRYDWEEPIYDYNEETDVKTLIGTTKKKYIDKQEYEAQLKEKQRLEEASKIEYLHNNGDKVVVSLKKIKEFSFETDFGYCYIVTYQSEEGNTYYYKGNSPKNEIKEDKFIKVQGSVKHNEYKGLKQTFLQRIKLV